jgi:SAM-dependent methyltransferase
MAFSLTRANRSPARILQDTTARGGVHLTNYGAPPAEVCGGAYDSDEYPGPSQEEKTPRFRRRMSLIGFTKSLALRAWAQVQKRILLRQGRPAEISRTEWSDSLRNPSGFYLKCFRYFHMNLPAELRAHRVYFSRKRRGFGEDAFHVMWFLLFREFKFQSFLEIGVYRGQTLSLAAMLQRNFGCEGVAAGISPFTSAGDSVSKYRTDVDYFEDTLTNFVHFSLPKPTLVKANSTETVALQFISAHEWDCIYIDGNHDYEVARQDWEICSRSLKPGGIIVLDDAGLTTSYRAQVFATTGHPGPSRLAQEIDRARFQETLQVGHNRVFQKIA